MAARAASGADQPPAITEPKLLTGWFLDEQGSRGRARVAQLPGASGTAEGVVGGPPEEHYDRVSQLVPVTAVGRHPSSPSRSEPTSSQDLRALAAFKSNNPPPRVNEECEVCKGCTIS